MDTILVLDFGGQTAQLITRRIRELGVYSEIVAGTTPYSASLLADVKGLIFSGSPYSVYETGSPRPDPRFYESGLPILGICYGFQRMTHDFGGVVALKSVREFGRAPVHLVEQNALFTGVDEGFNSWMSHGDSVERIAEGFRLIGSSESHPAAAFQPERRFFGIQFHPEVTHCEFGMTILENFAVSICGARRQWSIERYLDEITAQIRETAGSEPVLLLISGGVDSTVVGGLLLSSLDPEQVHLMYIDTGLMRKGENSEVVASLEQLGARHIHVVDASSEFLGALRGVADPEEKRRIIGDLFVTVQQREIARAIPGDYFLAQGTLYTDMIESGKGVGAIAHVIKSHHNVRSPLIEAKRASGRLIEPLSRLYKDEVRELGRRIGISPAVLRRHPFPGPGLAVRILGEVTKESCDLLREADSIFIQELLERNLYDKIWQAFSVLLPIQSVGVTGDMRQYGRVLALRAIVSRDGMTADVYPFDVNELAAISSRITNEIRGIGRVVYDISSKPPATIEWE
ncbi:MAG TPA: glutamine-hydrolyzing GMP synthase [Spirochaetia bacterium]|nr:glutamine-hydrolyzing GMP synthase [Spirochaetia bacterium]